MRLGRLWEFSRFFGFELCREVWSVIVVKSNNDDINTLKDLKNKRVAVSHKEGFASYLIPYDLLTENGIDMEKDSKLVLTGQPMEKVWDALNSGKADVGVFRTGYLEELIAKGKLKQSDIKVINPQKVEGFHYMLSSKLYPEWSVSATKHTSSDEVKTITLALYAIKNSTSSEYDSFTVPSSYVSTREMMQKYHIYPFNKFSFYFLKKYERLIELGVLLLLLGSWAFTYYYIKSSQKIRESAKQLQIILTTASDGIHVYDKAGNFIFFSDIFHTMLGYTREEMEKLIVFDLEKKITQEQITFIIDDVVKNKKVLRFESQQQKKDGTLIDVELIINSIVVDRKDYIYAVSRDITEIKKQRELLEQQKEEFETIFETTKDGIAVLDFESHFLKVNQAYTDITGLSKEELLETSCIALSVPEDIEKAKQIFKDVAREIDVEDFEKACLIKGNKIVVSMSLALMPDKEHILVSIKNISQQKLFEAQSKLASLGEMIGNITHQWRQPLSVISTIASGIGFRNDMGTLKEYPNTSSDMETIMVQIEYLSRTIEDFRDFIRGDIFKKSVYARQVIAKTLSIAGASMKKNDITLILNDTEDFIFEGYENELVQAFLNIINNAKDAMVEKVSLEDAKYIFINIVNQSEKYIEFLDNGGGISDEVLPRIFEAYFTTKPQDIGTGIGLSMTHQIVTERHNAHIEVSNKEYEYNGNKCRGASFKITFVN
jgi:PAS domain S-box-containing protein